MNFFGSLSRGIDIFFASWKKLTQSPSLIIWSLIIASIKCFLIMLLVIKMSWLPSSETTLWGPELVVGPFIQTADTTYTLSTNDAGYILSIMRNMLVTLFILFFLGNIFKYAVALYAGGVASNKYESFFRELLHALRHTPRILFFMLINGFVGILVGIIRGSKKESTHSAISMVREYSARVFEFGWKLATYLSIPLMAIKQESAIGSIQNSVRLMTKTFGESLGGTTIFGFIRSALLLFFIPLIIFGMSTHTNQAADKLFIHINLIYFFLICSLFIALRHMVLAAEYIFRTGVLMHATNDEQGLRHLGITKNEIESALKN